MVKIVTMCRQGLVRDPALTDVFKLYFEPVDVIPIGHFGNTKETREMLCKWARLNAGKLGMKEHSKRV